MESALAIPYADTRADMLSLSLDDPDLPALAALTFTVHDASMTLRLLGASHQVALVLPSASAGGDRVVRETVACSPHAGGPLPRALERADYTFTANTTGPDADALVATVDRLRRELGDDPHALMGHYPGDVNAVTAIRAAAVDGGVAWQTWHTYPQSGHVVHTSSRARWDRP